MHRWAAAVEATNHFLKSIFSATLCISITFFPFLITMTGVMHDFLKMFPWAISLVLFAFTTILGWNYYGERACIYLFGTKGVLPYRLIFIVLIASGAFLKLEAIWILADIVNGLMAIPNLIALLALSGVIVAETKAYMEWRKEQGEN